MKAGRELDVLVAEIVMGWAILTPEQTQRLEDVNDQMCVLLPDDHFGLTRYQLEGDMWQMKRWHPSTDIAAAWQVVEHMQSHGLGVAFHVRERGYIFEVMPRDYSPWSRGYGATATMAICLAALAAVGITPDTEEEP